MRRILLAVLACSVAGMVSTSASITVEAYYRLGETGDTGGPPTDSSGNNRNFIVTNPNAVGNAVVSSTAPPPGSTQYYVLENMAGFSDVGWDPPEDNVGVECWAQSRDLTFDTFNTLGTVVFGTGHNLNGIGILYNDFGAGFIGVIGNVNYVGLPYIPASTNEWVHLAVVRDSGVTTFYVNGVPRSPIRTDGVNNSTIPYLGYSDQSSKTNFNGAIDEARIFTFKPGEFYRADLLFFQSTNTLPYITTFKGTLEGFTIKLQDKTTAVNAGTVALQFDGTPLTAGTNITQAGGLTTITYTAPAFLTSGSSHTVNLIFADNAATPVYQTNDLSFVVAAYASLPADSLMPPGSVDTGTRGFRIRPYQTEAAQPNTLAWTEDQLIGVYGPNIATLTGADANGFIDYSGVINFSIEAGSGTDRGDFANDIAFPGIPGTTGLTGNSSMEVVTFLEFPTAGVYTMGVNSDDGFKVTVGKNPRDRFALILGQFNGGRGASDTLFTLTVPQAGIYPFRLIWENGNGELSAGNQANCEWFTVQSDGTKVLINDTTSPIKAYRSGPLPPFVSRLIPAINEIGVLPDVTIQVELTDGTSTQVKQDSIQLAVNSGGLAAPGSVNKAGSVTTAKLTPATPFAVSSVNTLQLAWADTGTFTSTNTWQFTVLDATLPPELRTAPGSGKTPGFRVHTFQVPTFTANGTANSGIVNEVPVGNSLFLGVWGTNIADLSQAVNGTFAVPGVVNWSRDISETGTEIGFFQSPEHPDAPIPGMPGMTSEGVSTYENFAAEVLTYVEFPSAGVYTMGVNSDDGFRVTAAADANPGAGAVRVTEPAGKAGNYCGLATYAANGGAFGGPWPHSPALVRKLVRATDGTTENDSDGVTVGDSYMFLVGPVVNGAELSGNIAVTRRGGGITFAQKARYCQDAGALAVIVVNRADQAGQKPWGMGGSDPGVTIPCIMIDWSDWVALKDVTTTNTATTQVTLSLTDDDRPMLGQYDGGRGQGTPTLFSFYVPQAGVYPLRLMWEQGQGGANCEWFSVDALGNYVLLNDPNNTAALKAYQERTAPVTPTISISLTGGSPVLTYTGTLQAASVVTGTYTNVTGAVSPYAVPTGTAGQSFYRTRN